MLGFCPGEKINKKSGYWILKKELDETTLIEQNLFVKNLQLKIKIIYNYNE